MATARDCAREVLDVVPLIMRAIRVEMRSRRGAELSIPQFRALLYIEHHPGAPLADVAAFLGLTPPSASRLVDGLVERRQVTRGESSVDRRRLALELTPGGRRRLDLARQGTMDTLAHMLGAMTAPQRTRLIETFESLRPAFSPGPETTEAG